VADEGGEDHSGTLGGLRRHGVNDMVGERVGEGALESLKGVVVASGKFSGNIGSGRRHC